LDDRYTPTAEVAYMYCPVDEMATYQVLFAKPDAVAHELPEFVE